MLGARRKQDKTLSQVRTPTIFTGPYFVTVFNRSKALAFGVSPSEFLRHAQRHHGLVVHQLLRLRNAFVQVLVQAKAK